MPMTSTDVRSRLVEALELDLIGPTNEHLCAREFLPQSPQRWYLGGYLVPRQAPAEQRLGGDDEMGMEEGKAGQGDDEENPDAQQNQPSYRPSSMGLTVLLTPETRTVCATVRWGDYLGEALAGAKKDEEDLDEDSVDEAFEKEMSEISTDELIVGDEKLAEQPATYGAKTKRLRRGFRREPREEAVIIELVDDRGTQELEVPNSRGLRLLIDWQVLPAMAGTKLAQGARSLSVFLVNDRPSAGKRIRYRSIAFQVELELSNPVGFWGRPDLRGLVAPEEADNDERISDLHYRDVLEYGVGHGVSVSAPEDAPGVCRRVSTIWIPSAEVPRVDHADQNVIGPVQTSMEALGELHTMDEVRTALDPLVQSYREWISVQEAKIEGSELNDSRRETAFELIIGAKTAADRIEAGILLLEDPMCLYAFRLANRAMSRAARQRTAVQQGIAPDMVAPPSWRAFQLAFILMNLRGLVQPSHLDRRTVDLLFFPTGGGKTEAYLGLAAFTLVLRRLKHPEISGAGVSIIMRYTLRLLTLDQLGRAAALMCALELERKSGSRLGNWPFEIGLWVGSAATPNRMGAAQDDSPGQEHTAYVKLTKYRNKPGKEPSPIPLEECPWCGTRFTPDSFQLVPAGAAEPTDLRICCDNMNCPFSAAQNDSCLPIIGVDEPIYRRLPCFLIATVDKFAALPWIGRVGALFGRVDRQDAQGFYGPCDTDRGTALPGGCLPPPDLIIQDELHLISGPLGTVAGIYEAAIADLCRGSLPDGSEVVPKIVASTATVRRAERQIRALFGREQTAIFPPPGPDRDDSFFAYTVPATEDNPGRLYLGLAAQGRSMKVLLLRTSLALLCAAEQLYRSAGGPDPRNPADPYMTLLGYFNSLRELGGSRRIIEDEVHVQCHYRWKRNRTDPPQNLFQTRYIKRHPVELTSRVSTNNVSQAKRQLGTDFTDVKQRIDVALATNMISVGLDIVRLGLMVVFGQPKTSSEYIQATSRVGRDKNKPGLVVTLLNAHRPRDRSYYERFNVYHRTFYRSVEATSVTPFSPRALDRALAGALVGLCRHQLPDMVPPTAASRVGSHLPALQQAVRVFSDRARIHDVDKSSTQEGIDLAQRVQEVAEELLARWCAISTFSAKEGGTLAYQKSEGGRHATALMHDFLDRNLDSKDPVFQLFRANRSMRDVEAAIDIQVKPSSQGTNQ